MHKLIFAIFLGLGLPSCLLAADLSDLTYVIEGDELTIINCNEAATGELLIPATIEGKAVTRIGIKAFLACGDLTSVTISEGITTISDEAFFNCGLTSIRIPTSVSQIGASAFLDCPNLIEIEVAEDNELFISSDGVLYNKGQTVILRYPSAKIAVSYDIPQGVETIGLGAFFDSDWLESVSIPDSVTLIGEYAFYSCEKLRHISLPLNLSVIEDSAFMYSGVQEASIPDSVTSIGSEAFGNCRALSSVSFGENVDSIGDYAFVDCDTLADVTFEGDAPTDFGAYALGWVHADVTIYFYEGQSGFTTPTWKGYPSVMLPYPDSDHDSWPDVLEALLGTDPNNAGSQFRTWLTQEAGATRIHYGPYSDACTFVVECTEDLNDPDSWAPVAGLGFTGDLTEQVADLGPTSGGPKFYRVQVSYTEE